MSRSLALLKLVGVALDARRTPRGDDPVALARTTRAVATGALAHGHGRALALVRVASLDDLLGVLASAPVLVDRTALPLRWALALRALGVPLPADLRGAHVLTLAPVGSGSYQVHVRPPQLLTA